VHEALVATSSVMHANMEDEIERFVTRSRLIHILPDDF